MENLSFKDFLDPLEVEDLESLFPQRNEKLRSLSASFFDRKYLLSCEPTGPVRPQRQAVYVKAKSGNGQKILVGLLWTALFGKNFKVIHWNLLFDILLRTAKDDGPSRALMLILRLTATSKDARDLNTNLDPVRRIIRRSTQKDEEYRFKMNQFERLLGIRLPGKDPKIENLLEFHQGPYSARPATRSQRKRGYNDKGHLPDKTNPKVPLGSSEPLEEKEDIFALLLRQTDSAFRRYSP